MSDSDLFSSSSSSESTPRRHQQEAAATSEEEQQQGNNQHQIGANGETNSTAPSHSSSSASASTSSSSSFLSSVPVSSPFLTLSPSSTVVFTDFPRVAHSFGVVHQQVQHGLERLKTVAEFIKRVCTAKANYAQELLKTSAAYAATTTTTTTVQQRASSPLKSSIDVVNVLTFHDDAMSSSSTIWNSLREQLFEEARQEQEFATKVTQEIVTPMLQFYQDAEKKRKILQAHHAALSGQMKGLTEQLLQAKTKIVKQVQALQAQEAKEREASLAGDAPLALAQPATAKDESKTPAGSSAKRALASVGSFFKGLKEKASNSSSSSSSKSLESDSTIAGHGIAGGDSSEEMREKAYAAALSYQLAVASSNSRQAQYYSSDLPTLFSELQRLEIARLNCLKHYLSELAANQSLVVSPNKQRIQSLIQSVATMHSERDCTEFVDSVVSQVGAVVEPNPYSYDLAFTPEEIRTDKMKPTSAPVHVSEPVPGVASSDSLGRRSSLSSASPPPSFFGLSLDAQMDLQEARGLGSGGVLGRDLYDVPVVFQTLVQAIRDRPRAQHKPNLFFLAVDTASVEKLKVKLDSGDFSTNGVGIDVLAGCLKLWLRSLPSPLLPVALYAAAISAIKKDQSAQLADRQSHYEAALAVEKAGVMQGLDGTERTKSLHSATSPMAASTAAPTANGGDVPGGAPITNENQDRPRSSSNATAPQLGTTLSLPSLPTPQLYQYVLSIFSALPTLNQRVITQLALLLNELVTHAASVHAQNGASPQVLSPKFDKFPASSSSSGPSAAALQLAVGSDETNIDINKWANAMAQISAIFTPVILTNTQADTTEVRTPTTRRQPRTSLACHIPCDR